MHLDSTKVKSKYVDRKEERNIQMISRPTKKKKKMITVGRLEIKITDIEI